jgi:monomeric sarcosine oxidase
VKRADAVVVGAGLAGSAAAWVLASRGRDVVVLEAFEPGHRRGSSHGSARIFRRAYADPLYVRLTGEAGERWRRLQDEAGEELLRVTGELDFGPSPEPEKMHELLTAHGVAAELLRPDAAADRWPGFAFGDHPVLFHAEAGAIDADRAMAAMIRLAAARGADVRYSTPALGLERDGDTAIVHTADEPIAARVVIVAAGPWLPGLLGGLVRLPDLTVTQTQAFHFAPADPAAPADWPAFIYHHDETDLYGLPAGRDATMMPGSVKIGEHGMGTVTAADDRDGRVDPASRDRVRRFVRENLPGLDPEPRYDISCLYTSTPSENFVIDRQGPFVICSACSGHGAKFAPLTGEIAANLADGAAPEPHFTVAAHLR